MKAIVTNTTQRAVVKVVQLDVRPYLELLSCGHAGRVLFEPLEDASKRIGTMRECLVCRNALTTKRGKR